MNEPKCIVRTFNVEGKDMQGMELVIYESGLVLSVPEDERMSEATVDFVIDGRRSRYSLGNRVAEFFYYEDGSIAKIVVEPDA